MDQALNVRDAELLKWMGANSFRTSHYPYSEEMMQLADRQGFVIIDEVPAVGMNLFIPNAPDVFTPERVNEKTLEHHKTVLRELYQRDKNHPCVVMWSVTNEPHSSEETRSLSCLMLSASTVIFPGICIPAELKPSIQ